MSVIVGCLVLMHPDCMSLIVEASRSIFTRDGPALLKAMTTRQRQNKLWELGKQWLLAECVLCVVCTAVIWLFENHQNSTVRAQRVCSHSLTTWIS